MTNGVCLYGRGRLPVVALIKKGFFVLVSEILEKRVITYATKPFIGISSEYLTQKRPCRDARPVCDVVNKLILRWRFIFVPER